jgi:stage III sporulation protein AH
VTEDYFTATALDRQEAREKAIDVKKKNKESELASKEAKADAAEKISQIALDIQNEANIETLVKAKGFEECIAVISEGSVTVIVSADELLAAQTAQILTIVYETTGISPENVSIINKAG